MTASLPKALCLLVLCLVPACLPAGPESKTTDLVYDKNASNVAVLFGVPDNLPGVRVDMRELETMFRQPEYGLKVYSYIDKSPSEIAQLTGQHAKEVDANGTLLFYFSGHGAENGMLMAYGGMLDFANVSAAIKQNRTTPLKRLLTVVDACFSGNLVDGATAISNTGGPQTATAGSGDMGSGWDTGNGWDSGMGGWGNIFGLTGFDSEEDFRIYEQEYSEPLNDDTNRQIFEALRPYAGSDDGFGLQTTTLYEQLLVLSSSRKVETSADTSMGGAFTTGFRSALASMKSKPGAKIQDLLNTTVSNVRGYGHTPVYRAEPEAVVLNDLVFGATNTSTTTDPNTVQTRSGAAPSGLFLALGTDQTGMAPIYVSAPTTVTQVALCLGSAATCTATSLQNIMFKDDTSSDPARKRFVSVTNPALQAGNYTILGMANGQIVERKEVTFRAK